MTKRKSLKRKFIAKNTSMFPKEKVQLFGEYLWAKQEQIGRPLEPVDVVRDAESKLSPLHECFEWDDSIAAGQWRLVQARQLLNHIEVVIEMPNSETGHIRAFHHVFVDAESESESESLAKSGYVNIEEVIGNPEYHAQIIKRAVSELSIWRKRYKLYKELKPVFLAIEKVEKKIM